MTVREPLARGALAGVAGALTMSISTNSEMRLRGRPPSDAPARAIGRLLGIDTGGRRRKALLASGGHFAMSVSFGAARGAMERAGLRRPAADGALFALAMVPELVVVPALGAAEPPWRWSRADTAISLLHHGVYAIAANGAYRALGGRR